MAAAAGRHMLVGSSMRRVALVCVLFCTASCDFCHGEAKTVMWGWGENTFGALGRGDFQEAVLPPAPTRWRGEVAMMAAGGYHALVLTPEGKVWGWGQGVGNRPRPTYLEGIKAVAAGNRHSVALTADGRVVAWGPGQRGAPVRGQRDDGVVELPGLGDVIAIDALADYSVALKRDGSVWAWGECPTWQPHGGSRVTRAVPEEIGRVPGGTVVSAGFLGPIVLGDDGTVWNLARPYRGKLVPSGQRGPPMGPGGRILDLEKVTAIAAGKAYIALGADGAVWAWGDEVGDGTMKWRAKPVAVSGLPRVVAIDADLFRVLAVAGDGTVWGWGVNFSGQTSGRRDGDDHLSPVKVEGIRGCRMVAAATYFSLAVCGR